jgi:hypothetical protein
LTGLGMPQILLGALVLLIVLVALILIVRRIQG